MGMKLGTIGIACVAFAASAAGQGSSRRLIVTFPQQWHVVQSEGGYTGTFSHGSVSVYAVPSAAPCDSLTDDFVRGALADAPRTRTQSFVRNGHRITAIYYPNGASASVSTVCRGERAMIVSAVFQPTNDEAVVNDALREYLNVLSSVRYDGQPLVPSSGGESWETRNGLSGSLDTPGATSPDPSRLPQLLLGEWTFDKGQGIGGTIAFAADGTYHYQVGVGRAWRVEHVGSYAIVPANDPFRVLRLHPTRILSEGSATSALALGQRRMLDNDPGDFYIFGDERALRLEDVRCGSSCVQTWTINRTPTRP